MGILISSRGICCPVNIRQAEVTCHRNWLVFVFFTQSADVVNNFNINGVIAIWWAITSTNNDRFFVLFVCFNFYSNKFTVLKVNIFDHDIIL